MILKSITLNNIRSYVNETVVFPEGSVLLSGDIGSGKTTILLAAEFALFGLLRGTSSGNDILRNGKKEGFVELRFSTGNNKSSGENKEDIIIKRTLKRVKDSVSQSSGYIIKNGIKKEGTPIEIKSEIIDILGYPKELISKSKSLIYRYTVYTPQEEMKAILFEDKELRLDTLRKVFGIDKYKKIRENALIYTKELKTRIREYKAIIIDFEIKQKKHKEIQERINEASKYLVEKEIQLKKASDITIQKKEKKEIIETEVKKFNELKNKLSLLDLQLKQKVFQSSRNSKEILLLEQDISKLAHESHNIDEKSLDSVKIKEKIIKLNNDLKNFDKERIKINSDIGFETQVINQSQATKNKVSEIANCPLCLQKVDFKHKHDIQQKQDSVIIESKKNILSLEAAQIQISEKIKTVQTLLDRAKQEFADIELTRLRRNNLKEKRAKKDALEKENSELKKEIGDINTKKIDVSNRVKKFEFIEESYTQSKTQYELALKEENNLKIQFASLNKEIDGYSALLDEIRGELDKMIATKKKIASSQEFLMWIEESFINLMISMEKHVMMSIYSEFNELFMRWFSVLIEDENLNIRLDDEFTPVVVQNGYEIDISSLSGGEKTSLALAYRLSLNKVINDLMDSINTKDLIILDEPTDGFSTEQLDRTRDVLDELNIKQVIIVSHEQKIESFVDNVIRIVKNEHISRVVVG